MNGISIISHVLSRQMIGLFFIFLLMGSIVFAEEPRLHLVDGDRFITALVYDTDQNFLKRNVYAEFNLHQCYVHADLYDRLLRMVPRLRAEKLKLVLLDCYRPIEVQRAMWDILPDRRYVGDPQHGSNHNRGVALDVTLATETNESLIMVTPFDDFSKKASPNYVCTPQELSLCQNRDRLISIMASVGLIPLPSEWWHFQLQNARAYPILSQTIQ